MATGGYADFTGLSSLWMAFMFLEGNNYAFIDSQNLNLGVRSQGWILDFFRFRIYLKDKYQITKAFLFIGYVPDNSWRYTMLQQAGYVIIFKPTLAHKSGKQLVVKGNVDAELVLHTMIEHKNYEKAMIVSGDGDFYCLVEYLHQQNKLLKIVVPNKRYSSLLRKFSWYIVNVGLFRAKLEKTNKTKREAFPRDKTLW